MNDLDLIADLMPEAALPGLAELTPARDRLYAAITAEEAAERTPLPTAPARRLRLIRATGGGPRGRPSQWLAVTAAVAAVVAAGATALVVVPGHGQKSAAGGAPGSSVTRTAPAPSAALPSPGTADIATARFLRQAAAAVRLERVNPPGPEQFVYTQTEGARGASKDRQWLSTYGNRDGLVHNAGQKSFVLPPCPVEKSPPGDSPPTCAEEAGYLPSMPTSPKELLAYLYKIGVAQPGDSNGTSWATNDLGKAVDFLMSTTYLLPAQQAALFELMARFPGFTVVHGARDAIGRVGVGVEWNYGGRAEIILSPKTYAYLGDRTWPDPDLKGCKDCQNMPKGWQSAYDGEALVKMAFVDRAGELP